MNIRLATQPIVNATTGQTLAFELLARVSHEGQLFSPAILPRRSWLRLDSSVMGSLLARKGESSASLPVYLNLSAETLACNVAFARWHSDAALLCRMSPAGVGIEISENTPRGVLEHRWSALASLGAQLILDDFGTGVTCLEHLQAFPWDVCKFETPRLMEGLDEEAVAHCRDYGIATIAEKVETPAQRCAMTQCGIDIHQGYLYARPALLPLAAHEPQQVVQ